MTRTHRATAGVWPDDAFLPRTRIDSWRSEGVERSTALYRALIDDLAFEVLDQVAEGDRVASRLIVTGSNCGRRLRLEGTTLSRLQDGRIVDDWSGFDTLELLRQLGLVRTLLAAPRMLRAVRGASSP